ncbi:hypothetical protein [Hymenobacter psychrotolerans]|uniref:Glyoxalase-like domain-containing protein n=1 Tax=Hymenobacter psychrotolerans DSM 18569 TaxID=1121959 RepID=A0A1M7BXT8_9BACT|nr:hypothetical protein [Hymenobacter psychrotolerans]SHL59801.1 hypothetical protein SAMN02746009_03044 [Hymenobacter psychrotolerans DSM 18569]
MKICFPAALVAALALQAPAWAQTTPAATGGSSALGLATQKTVLYPSRNGRALDAEVVSWYSGFFGRPPTSSQLAGQQPYLIYDIDGIRVCVGVDPDHPDTSLGLERTAFYWMLPTAAAVEDKFEALKRADSRFVGFIVKLRKVAQRKDNDSQAARSQQAVQEVKEFIVKDPLGNEIGVINNPIYVPTR